MSSSILTPQTLDPDSRERLTELAVSIFASQPPQDKTDLRAEDLLKANVREDMCVATGRLLKGQPAVRCKARHLGTGSIVSYYIYDEINGCNDRTARQDPHFAPPQTPKSYT